MRLEQMAGTSYCQRKSKGMDQLHETNIGYEHCYRNAYSSTILAKARTNSMKLTYIGYEHCYIAMIYM